MGVDLKEDPTFFDRADSFIHLANEHCANIGRGKVSASLMYSSARFQAWNAATWSESSAEMQTKRDEALNYLVEQYRSMLEENIDDYIKNFEQYMKVPNEE
ncbi:MAG: DUF3144 domain-containing protein [Leptothrix sp. (in: Bacteria)]|nr:DUF3144 domain-containing protein [Leptothrix sp. (in: b-proteobacteria)]